MNDVIQIKGGAGEFEAAVIAVVLDQLESDKQKPIRASNDLPPWVLAVGNQARPAPLRIVKPR